MHYAGTRAPRAEHSPLRSILLFRPASAVFGYTAAENVEFARTRAIELARHVLTGADSAVTYARQCYVEARRGIGEANRGISRGIDIRNKRLARSIAFRAFNACLRLLRAYGHYGVATADMLSAAPTWLGAYRKADAEGMEASDAAAYAGQDGAERPRRAGCAGPGGDPARRRSHEGHDDVLWLFSHIANRQVVGVRAAASGVRNLRAGNSAGARRDFARALSTFWFYLATPALIEAYATSGGPDDEHGEGWLGWAARSILGEVPAGVPVLRDIAKAAISGREFEQSPIKQAGDTAVASGKDIGAALGRRHDKQGNPAQVSDRWLQHAVEVPGYVFGLPTGQAAGTVQFLHDVAAGNQEPASVSDFLRGVVYGPPPKHGR